MATRRYRSGRLNMDAVREDPKDEPVVFPLCEENVPHQRPSSQYTAEWVERAEFPPTTRSLSQDLGVGSATKDASPRVSKSAPALSVRSRQSAGGMVSGKLQLQLQLEQLRKRQALEKETRELEMEIKRQELELERERRLAELAERKALQRLEAQLAEAELIEQREVGYDDQCLSSDEENEGQNVAELPERDNYSPQRGEAERREAEQREAEQREAEQREAERREAEQREAEQREAEQREAEQREAEQREAEQREAERREARRREAEQREAEWREAERREARRREAERHETEQRNVEQRESGRRETDRLKQGYNQVEPFVTRRRDEQCRENALPAEQQFQTHYVPPVNTFSPQHHARKNHSLQCRNIGITNPKTKPEECMLVSKVCRVLCQERITM